LEKLGSCILFGFCFVFRTLLPAAAAPPVTACCLLPAASLPLLPCAACANRRQIAAGPGSSNWV
jgi:hypothetical protein